MEDTVHLFEQLRSCETNTLGVLILESAFLSISSKIHVKQTLLLVGIFESILM